MQGKRTLELRITNPQLNKNNEGEVLSKENQAWHHSQCKILPVGFKPDLNTIMKFYQWVLNEIWIASGIEKEMKFKNNRKLQIDLKVDPIALQKMNLYLLITLSESGQEYPWIHEPVVT